MNLLGQDRTSSFWVVDEVLIIVCECVCMEEMRLNRKRKQKVRLRNTILTSGFYPSTKMPRKNSASQVSFEGNLETRASRRPSPMSSNTGGLFARIAVTAAAILEKKCSSQYNFIITGPVRIRPPCRRAVPQRGCASPCIVVVPCHLAPAPPGPGSIPSLGHGGT